jgi:DMSO/TMAO reductase YedYZ molybdopterin-dependent catalytic subunit
MEHTSPALSADCHPAPIASLGLDTMPAGQHFLRSHFGVPQLDPDLHVVEITGLVKRSVRWTLNDVRKLSQVSTHVTLECAGHRRTELEPQPLGVPWALGAVSHARWAGAQLADLFEIVRPLPEATHIVFSGADTGTVEGRAQPEPFARAIPLRDPVVREIILAWSMNGQGLTPEHGAPLRVVVPGWYAVSSVKWLSRIEFVGHEFDGFFQAVDYRLQEDGDAGPGRELTQMPVHSLVTFPTEAETITSGTVTITGTAWGGVGGIGPVELQIDDGPWQRVRTEPGPGIHAPTQFAHAVDLAPGTHTVRSRATDRKGSTQPDSIPWNSRGYGVNSLCSQTFTVI